MQNGALRHPCPLTFPRLLPPPRRILSPQKEVTSRQGDTSEPLLQMRQPESVPLHYGPSRGIDCQSQPAGLRCPEVTLWSHKGPDKRSSHIALHLSRFSSPRTQAASAASTRLLSALPERGPALQGQARRPGTCRLCQSPLYVWPEIPRQGRHTAQRLGRGQEAHSQEGSSGHTLPGRGPNAHVQNPSLRDRQKQTCRRTATLPASCPQVVVIPTTSLRWGTRAPTLTSRDSARRGAPQLVLSQAGLHFQVWLQSECRLRSLGFLAAQSSAPQWHQAAFQGAQVLVPHAERAALS